MRRRTLLLAAVPAGLGALAGCSSSSQGKAAAGTSAPASGAPSASPSAAFASPPKIAAGPLPAITAGTAFGHKPTVAKGPGQPSKDLAAQTAIAGRGRTVAQGDYIVADYLGQIWASAKVFDNSYDRKAPLIIQLAQGSVIDGWRYALPGHRTGSRVELAVPPAYGYGPQGNQQAGIAGSDTLVFVVDIEGSYDSKSSAHGTAVPQKDPALPTVGTATDGTAPAIAVPKAAAPGKLVADYILEGDGPQVAAGSTVLVQYKGVLWDTGKEFDSTYSRNALASFSLQQVVKGWAQGLTGKKAGSRVLIVVPPDLGYGSSPPAGSPITKNSTLVFSVDILAAT